VRKTFIIAFVLLLLAGADAYARQSRVFARGFQGTENLAFTRDGLLYVSDTNHLWEVDANGKTEKIYTRDPEVDGISLGGVSAGPEEKIYFSAGNRILVFAPAEDEVNELVSGFEFANGNCFDNKGNFYIADSNKRAIYVVPAGENKARVLKSHAGWVNGLTWGESHSTLYYTVSWPGKVSGLRLGADLEILEEKTVARFPFSGLDDLTMDPAGNFYVCAWLNGKVYKVTAGGDKELMLENIDGPSALAFGKGTDKDVLYICVKGKTTAFKGDKIITFRPGPE